MKSLCLVLLLCLSAIVSGSELRLDSVWLPLYLHGSESDPRISFQSVPFTTFHADPEWRFGAIAKPFIPSTDGSWKPHDVNLTSLYAVTVEGEHKENGMDLVVTIDASKAVAPEGYPFTVEQVIDAVTTCVKLMYPPRPKEDGTFELKVLRPKEKRSKAK